MDGITIIVLLLIIIVIFVAYKQAMKNEKFSIIWEKLKYEVIYLYIGFTSVLEDMWKIGRNKTDLPEKPDYVVVITGGLRGIGLEVIRMLLECDVTIIVGCRDVEKSEHFALKMREEGTHLGRIGFKYLDVSLMESVKMFAESVRREHTKINALINNAAIMYVPFALTSEGYESQYATNYLGHVYLTHLLLDRLKAAGTDDDHARIVNVTSVAHATGKIDFDDINTERPYIAFKAYAQSKLALLLFSTYLNRMLRKKAWFVESYGVHPGIVNTELFNDTFLKKISPFLLNAFTKPPDKGAVPIVFCAISHGAKCMGGKYISNCESKNTAALQNSEDLQKKLFEFTMNQLKIKEFGKVV